MTVDNDTVRRVARLARIAVAEDEIAPLAAEMNSILDWVNQMSEADIDGVEPMTGAVPQALRWREDTVTDGSIQDKVLANAPATREGFFVVPKVVE